MIQELIIYRDDDTTVLTTVGTDVAHVRPYLKFAENVGESELRLWEGDSTIGQLTVEIVDKRTDPADQQTGWFTALLAATAGVAKGNTQLNGRRALLRESRDGGATWEDILDGVIRAVTMNQQIVTYRLSLRDIRERERKVRAFERADSTVIFPYIGPKDAWGHMSTLGVDGILYTDSGAVLPVLGYDATWVLDGAIDGTTSYGHFEFAASPLVLKHTVNLRDVWERHGAATRVTSGEFTGTERYRSATIEWSLGATTKTFTDFAIPPNASTNAPNLFEFHEQVFHEIYGGKQFVLKAIHVVGPTADMPANGTVVRVRVMSLLPPTDEVPYFLEVESFGHLVQNLYDGVYSDPTIPPNVRYDQGAVDAMKAASGRVVAMFREPWKDMREEMREQVWKPSGFLPSIRNGRVFPLQYRLPSPTEPLLVLDDTNCHPDSAWEHGSGHIVNVVEFTFKRDIIPTLLGPDVPITTEEVTHAFESNYATVLHGAKPMKFKAETIREIVPMFGGWRAEFGTAMIRQRAFEMLDRFSHGAQEMTVKASTRDAGVAAAHAGDWCHVALSWLPDYGSGRRGANRIGQITKVKKEGPWRIFTIVDAGALAQPVPQAVVNTPATTADGRISVNVAGLPALPDGRTGQVEIQFAVANIQPDADAGIWELLDRRDALGVVASRQLPSGGRVYIQYRGVHEGVRPAAWASLGFVTLPTVAILHDVALTVGDNGVPSVAVGYGGATASVRVRWARHAAGTAAPALSGTSTFNTDGTGVQTFVLPFTLAQGEQVTVEVDTFTAINAGGTLGGTSTALTSSFTSLVFAGPLVTEDRTLAGGTGTLTLTVNDPQGRVTEIAFSTQQDGGAWSAYVADPTAPYAASVPVAVNGASAIRYRVTGRDAAGNLSVLAQSEVPFQDVLAGAMQVGAVLVSATATETTWEVSAIGPDGAHGEVEVTSMGGSATLAGGAVVGQNYPSPKQFVFARGAANGPDGAAHVRGMGTGWSNDDDTIVVPAQGRDTVPLAVSARPGAQTAAATNAFVSITDPIPSAGPYISLVVRLTGLQPVTLVGAGTYPDGAVIVVSSGQEWEFSMPRPVRGQPMGRVTFLASATGRVSDSDSVDVQAQDQAFASVKVGSVGVSDQEVVLSGFVWSPQTARVDVFVREYLTDPGVPSSVERSGYTPPESPLLSAAEALEIPVGVPGSWVVVTLVAKDVNGRAGSGSEAGTGITSGRITIKAQAAATPPLTTPPPPADLTLAMGAGTDVALSVTMPADITNVATLRVYRDGGPIMDVARTAGANLVQTITDPARSPGATHRYYVSSVNGTGTMSTTPSVERTITVPSATKIPTPTVWLDAYVMATDTFDIHIEPAEGTPSGVSWVIEHSNVAYGEFSGVYAAVAESPSSATIVTHYHARTGTHRTDWIRVKGTGGGALDSDWSEEMSQTMPI